MATAKCGSMPNVMFVTPQAKETFFVGMGFKAEARPAAQDAGTDGAADTGQEPGVL